MSEPKQHHYVPQMLLKRFTSSTGNLFFSRSEWASDRVLSSTPEKLLKERHLYTYTNAEGVKDLSLEKKYADLETQACPVIDKIITLARSKRYPDLTEDEFLILVNFIYHQWRRVPDMFYRVCDKDNPSLFISIVEDHLESNGQQITEEERLYLSHKPTLDRIIQGAKVQSLSITDGKVLPTLKSMNLRVVAIEKSNKSFVIGSNPVMKLVDSKFPQLTHRASEVWLPISADVAVCLCHYTNKKIDNLNDKIIRHLNTVMTKQSRVIVGKSEELIKSLRNPC